MYADLSSVISIESGGNAPAISAMLWTGLLSALSLDWTGSLTCCMVLSVSSSDSTIKDLIRLSTVSAGGIPLLGGHRLVSDWVLVRRNLDLRFLVP